MKIALHRPDFSKGYRITWQNIVVFSPAHSSPQRDSMFGTPVVVTKVKGYGVTFWLYPLRYLTGIEIGIWICVEHPHIPGRIY